MALTLEFEQRLGDAGLIEFFDAHRGAWEALAKKAYDFLRLNLSTAKADDIEREIRLLKAQIKRLEEKVAKQEQQVRGIAKSPKMPPVAETPIVCKLRALSPAISAGFRELRQWTTG